MILENDQKLFMKLVSGNGPYITKMIPTSRGWLSSVEPGPGEHFLKHFLKVKNSRALLRG